MTPETQAEHARLFEVQDGILVSLTSTTPRLDDADRLALYSLPPWRAVMFARLAERCGAMPRAERDGLVREAGSVGGKGVLKPWAERTPRERSHGVRAGVTTGLSGG